MENFFTRIFSRGRTTGTGEHRSDASTMDPDAFGESLFFGRAVSGTTVNSSSALKLTAVLACVRVLSETIASLPFELYEDKGDGVVVPAKGHENYFLVSQSPNEMQTSFTWRESMQTQLCLLGNGYSFISRGANNKIEALIYLPASEVTVSKTGQKLVYKFKLDGKEKIAQARDVIHIPALATNGYMGLSPIGAARESIGFALNHQQFGSTFFENGARPAGVLELDKPLTEPAWKRLRNSWQKQYTGVKNQSKVAILEDGVKYKQISISPDDAKFLEVGKLLVEDIARIFRVPLHLIGNLDRATDNNIEHLSIAFVVHTIRPWVKRWEQELDRKLITGDDRGKYFHKFNLNGLMRGDSVARAEFYSKLWGVGALSPNDIRGLENMNPIEGGETYFRPLNMEDLKNKNTIDGSDQEDV